MSININKSTLTDGRGIIKGTKVLIDNKNFVYLGFDEINKKHFFENDEQEEKILTSLRECFKASIKYQNMTSNKKIAL